MPPIRFYDYVAYINKPYETPTGTTRKFVASHGGSVVLGKSTDDDVRFPLRVNTESFSDLLGCLDENLDEVFDPSFMGEITSLVESRPGAELRCVVSRYRETILINFRTFATRKDSGEMVPTNGLALSAEEIYPFLVGADMVLPRAYCTNKKQEQVCRELAVALGESIQPARAEDVTKAFRTITSTPKYLALVAELERKAGVVCDEWAEGERLALMTEALVKTNLLKKRVFRLLELRRSRGAPSTGFQEVDASERAEKELEAAREMLKKKASVSTEHFVLHPIFIRSIHFRTKSTTPSAAATTTIASALPMVVMMMMQRRRRTFLNRRRCLPCRRPTPPHRDNPLTASPGPRLPPQALSRKP